MTEKRKNQSNYARVPAQQLVLEKRLEAVMAFNGQLLQLITAHFPALKQDAIKIDQAFGQNMALVAGMEGDLILRGHGPRGVLASQKLATKNDNDKFESGLVKPSEEPLQGGQLFEILASYLQAEAGEQGRAWVLPDESMYGQLVKDGAKVKDTDVTELADGIYVIQGDEQQAYYTLKLTLDDGILVFSPAQGPALLTYNPLEQQWTRHTSWKYANGPKALKAIEAFFSSSNVHDVSPAELKKLETTLRKMPEAKLEGLATVSESGIDLVLNPIFKITFPNEGEAKIVASRDDVQWTDVTLFGRRTLFRDAVARVAKANADAAPKAVAKKAAKKAGAKK